MQKERDEERDDARPVDGRGVSGQPVARRFQRGSRAPLEVRDRRRARIGARAAPGQAPP